MGSRERSQNFTDTSDQNVEWSRYGIGNSGNQRNGRRSTDGGYQEFGPEMYQSTGANELFAQEHVSHFSQIRFISLSIHYHIY